ncbi:MAG: hypothetical protein GY906_28915 [bacterium]|nr:hypothetical protein [bacterium]
MQKQPDSVHELRKVIASLRITLEHQRKTYEFGIDVERALKEETIMRLTEVRHELAHYRDASLWEHLKLWWKTRHWRLISRLSSFIR